MTFDEYATTLENLLFECVDGETIADECFRKMNINQRVEMSQDILTDYDISFPNIDDNLESEN